MKARLKLLPKLGINLYELWCRIFDEEVSLQCYVPARLAILREMRLRSLAIVLERMRISSIFSNKVGEKAEDHVT